MDTDTDTDMENLEKKKHWLENQLLEHKTAQRAQAAAEVEEDEDIDQILERIMHLQKELQEVSATNSIKESIIEKTHMGQNLTDLVYPPRSESASAEGDAAQEPDKEIIALLETQEKLSSQILQHHQAIQEMQPKLDEVNKENLELKASNRELMANLEALKEEQRTHASFAQSNENIASLQEQRKNLVAKTEILRGVFRRLIIGSGVDWGADEQLTELLISLGTPLDTLLDDTT